MAVLLFLAWILNLVKKQKTSIEQSILMPVLQYHLLSLVSCANQKKPVYIIIYVDS